MQSLTNFKNSFTPDKAPLSFPEPLNPCIKTLDRFLVLKEEFLTE